MKLRELIRKLEEIRDSDCLEGINPDVYLAFWSNFTNYDGLDKISDDGISFYNLEKDREKVIITSESSQYYGR